MTLFEDLRFGARVLAKRPWTTALMIGLLAAGIGVNTTVFTLVNAVLIRGLPYEDAERILYVEGYDAKRSDDLSTSLLDFIDWRDQTRSFESLAAYSQGESNLADDEAAPERVTGVEITVNGFEVLRVEPQLGRAFAPEESGPGAERVVILSHSVWQQRYGGAEDVIGKNLRIDEVERTIVGVMQPGFKFPIKSDLWIPLLETDDRKRDNRRLGVYGRLAPGVTPGEADVGMKLIGQRLQAEHPATNKDVDIVVQTFNENFNGDEIEAVFLAMMGAVGFVLLIACANVANIQLARAMDRAKEISIRSALGAGKLRIFRQLLAESVLLAFIGGALGFALAWVGVYYFDQVTLAVRPYWIDFSFDASIFAYLAVICLSAGVVFGMAPALHAVKRDVNDSLKQGRGQTTGSSVRFFASSMVVGEVAMAMILLVGAGLMIQSFWNVYNSELGARVDGVLSAGIELPESQYDDEADRYTFYEQLIEAAETLPGVQVAAMTSHSPARGANGTIVEIDGNLDDDPDQRPRERYVVVSPGFFDLFEASVVQGRDFDTRDTLESQQVVLVNRRFAEKYFPTENAIGRRIRGWDDDEEEQPWAEIVGVVSDIRTSANRQMEPVIYRTFNQNAWAYRRLLLRARGDVAALAPLVRQTVADLDANLPVFDVSTIEEELAQGRWPQRVFGSIFAMFGFVALAMSVAGIYGLVSYSVGRRTNEFGIRMALGAAGADIRKLIVSQGMWRVGIGIIIGLPAAYFAGQALQSIQMGVSATDPTMLIVVAVFLLGVALLACWVPARRAASVSPGTALHHE